MSQAAEPKGKMSIKQSATYEMYTQHKKYGPLSALVPIDSTLVPLIN
jgi:hypothetical protein